MDNNNSTAMEVDVNEKPYHQFMEDLVCQQPEKRYQSVINIKNFIIGSNFKKRSIVDHGFVAPLIALLTEEMLPKEVKVNTMFTLNMIGKSDQQLLKVILDANFIPVLINSLKSSETSVIEAGICCLRTSFRHVDAPVSLLYEDPSIVPILISYMNKSSPAIQMAVANIFIFTGCELEYQTTQCENGILHSLLNILSSSNINKVHLAALHCLSSLALKHDQIAKDIANFNENGNSLYTLIVSHMDRSLPRSIQLAAATCISYIYRRDVIPDNNKTLVYKVLPCLVRMVKPEVEWEIRLLAAETLSYLLEVSDSLQRIASITNHLIANMATFLNLKDDSLENSHRGEDMAQLTSTSHKDLDQIGLLLFDSSEPRSSRMKRAAFRTFASLSANDEGIRKKIIETKNLMPSLVEALEDSNPWTQQAAIVCLHSLSRSVKLLRTSFQDHPVWKPLMSMLSSSSNLLELQILASATLCNLLLEFSPSKEPIIDSGAIEILCTLTHKSESALKLNGVWGLMNVAFQVDQKIKVQILKNLKFDQIFHLLSDPDIDIVMKTLGLLRNLLSTKSHIDHIMTTNGKQIMQAVVLILESDNSPDVKEQALCILANIADGDTAKIFIMSNEDVLKKITSYLMHNNSKLQIAAVVCVQNLSWKGDEGSPMRQEKLKEIGVHKILHALLSSSPDSALYEKVKTVIQQYPST